MSTNRSTNPGQRQADYSNIGYAGRKTGVVLKQTLSRDEYGMPLLDDLFSSPERQPSPIKNTVQRTGAASSSAARRAQLASDIRTDPIQSSSPRKGPPPRARSPIKTSIGSPRKSINGPPPKTMGLLASPVRIGNRDQPDGNSAKENITDDFANTKHKRRSLEYAPRRPPVPLSGSVSQLLAPRKSLFEVPSSPAVPLEAAGQVNVGSNAGRSPSVFPATSAQVKQPNISTSSPQRSKAFRPVLSSEPKLFVSQGHTPPLSPNADRVLPVTATSESVQQKPAAKGKGKRRWSDIEAEEKLRAAKKRPKSVKQLQEVQEEFEPVIGGFDDGYNDEVPSVDDRSKEASEEHVLDVDLQPELSDPSPKPHEIQQVKVSPSIKSPSKRPLSPHNDSHGQPLRLSPSRRMAPPQQPTTYEVQGTQQKDRDANIVKMPGKQKGRVKSKAQPLDNIAPIPPSMVQISRPKRRGLQIMKDKDEEEPDVARYSRAGRLNARPIEYWGFERVIYSEPMQAEDERSLDKRNHNSQAEATAQQVKPTSKGKQSKSQKRAASVESEDDYVQEAWELEPGIYAADLPTWDPTQQRLDADVVEQVDIAVAPRGLESLVNAARGGGFNYAKTLTLPFYHAGMMDLPPGGAKEPRLSRRFHMTFWVRKGRVVVNVSGHEISIGKDSMWQVPRGCTYSVSNPYSKPARLYFSQGAYMTEEEGQAAERAQKAELAQE